MVSTEKEKNTASNQLFEPSVSQIISAARDNSGLSHDGVAEKTKIGSVYIKQIESDDVHNHLERVYVLGFIRTYCKVLGLDADDMIKKYKIERKWVNYPANFNELKKPQKKIKSARKGYLRYINERTVAFTIAILIAIIFTAVTLMNKKTEAVIEIKTKTEMKLATKKKASIKAKAKQKVEIIYDRDSPLTPARARTSK